MHKMASLVDTMRIASCFTRLPIAALVSFLFVGCSKNETKEYNKYPDMYLDSKKIEYIKKTTISLLRDGIDSSNIELKEYVDRVIKSDPEGKNAVEILGAPEMEEYIDAYKKYAPRVDPAPAPDCMKETVVGSLRLNKSCNMYMTVVFDIKECKVIDILIFPKTK